MTKAQTAAMIGKALVPKGMAMAIETRIDEDRQEWLSHHTLTYGDYAGSGTVGMANIRSLQENIADEFLNLERLSYGYHKLWIRADAPDIRETLEALDDYPLIDDETLSLLEDELTHEQFPTSDILREIENVLEESLPEGVPIYFHRYLDKRIRIDGIRAMTQYAHYDPWHAEGTGSDIYFDQERIVSHAIGYYVPLYLMSRSGGWLRRMSEYKHRVAECVALVLSEGKFDQAGCGAWKAICRSIGEKLDIDPTDFVQLSAFSDCLGEQFNVRHWIQDLIDGMLETLTQELFCEG